MWKSSGKLRLCVRITSTVILLSFLTNPVYAVPQTGLITILKEEGTRLYSDSDLDSLIDELSEAAKEAIEKAAAEAARAAALAGLEREAAMLREVAMHKADTQYWRLQAETNLLAISAVKKTGRKNAVIAGAVCLLSGLIVGVTGTLLIRN